MPSLQQLIWTAICQYTVTCYTLSCTHGVLLWISLLPVLKLGRGCCFGLCTSLRPSFWSNSVYSAVVQCSFDGALTVLCVLCVWLAVEDPCGKGGWQWTVVISSLWRYLQEKLHQVTGHGVSGLCEKLCCVYSLSWFLLILISMDFNVWRWV